MGGYTPHRGPDIPLSRDEQDDLFRQMSKRLKQRGIQDIPLLACEMENIYRMRATILHQRCGVIAMRLNEQELARLVEAQKRNLYRTRDERDEARDIAKQLLYELRQHVDTPETHVSFAWLNDSAPMTGKNESEP